MNLYRIVNEIFSSNTYVLREDESNDAFLVDIGDTDPVFALNLNIKGLILTHTHFDHIYGIERLAEHYPSCLIYTSATGSEYLGDAKLNLSKYHGKRIDFKSGNIREVSEGSEIDVFGQPMCVFETPGHSPTCLTFQMNKYLFTGDAYIPNTPVVTNLPKADKALAAANHQRIESMITCDTILCPGHGEIVYTKDY